ncbi:glycoside hydrolase family 3 protein [Bacteroides xylanisolvens]|jgi:beta-glucosidase|uniref:Glycoside hydrolase family 3 protein n=1 Tax=Bacteroides xylanisolvens TaxID=371601 RepID=A0A7J5PUV9_9BACE|nr:glycoside hydrolase family 3 N-terminal domain-containing protein [Bacteroides xylanisolvens]KAB6146739.1 glycoside hydrolase family 3 protein [Bacteroides xylanisolvens]
MKRYLIFGLVLIQLLFVNMLTAAQTGKCQEKCLPIYKNELYSFEERVKDVLSRMTLEEKVSQMATTAIAIPRLEIPQYEWSNECLHGLARAGKTTVFPQSIGLGATFDPDLVYRMADAISSEARVYYEQAQEKGNWGKYTGLTFFSPNVNLYRDPRWGRGQETYGEDPYLTSRLGVAFVKGLQGNDKKYMKTIACAKHFAVHSGPEGKRRYFNASATTKDMYETYLPAFKALVQEGKVGSVMGAHNRINGIPCNGNRELLVDILRKDWGFKGYVTSDCNSLSLFVTDHKVCKNKEQAAALAANSGLNLNCGWIYKASLVKAVQDGLVKESTVDSLLSTLLMARFKLGLFDNPKKVIYRKIDRNVVNSKTHQDIAYEAALKSMVLLENKNGLLPLKKDINYLYVTGPNANNPDALIGNYFGASDRLTTFFEGIAQKVPVGTTLQYRQGVMLNMVASNNWTVKEAAESDVVIACMGLTNMLEGESMDAIASNEKGDVLNLSLPEAQLNFLRDLKENVDKHQKKLVVVLTGGCPIILTEIRELADALIYAWYPGEAGGKALGDILFGNESPSGRVPITFVKSLEDLPPFENYNMEGRTYKYMKKVPLYPFGYGLSYTTFEYTGLNMPSTIKAGEALIVSVKVKNTGMTDADEVVQLYISDDVASVQNPIRRLAAFTRVSLKSGEEKNVVLTVQPDMMSVITDCNQRMIESGEFTISVGGGQPVFQTQSYVNGRVNVEGSKKLEL